MTIPHPIADYASAEMRRIWSDRNMVETERRWWVSVMRAQVAQGLDIPAEAIASSEECIKIGKHYPRTRDVLARIRERELITKHDVKARLEIFCEDAGHEYHHLGLTSADVVENTMQIRVRDSIRWLAKRHGLDDSHLDDYVLRGVHGAVGTDQDQLDLLGSAERVHFLNAWLCQVWGFLDYARTVPQVMHRSADLAVMTPVVSQVTDRTAGGSPWLAVARGYLGMLANIAGDVWNEGDVSSSVVRRVAVPNILFALEAALLDPSGRRVLD